MFCVWTGVLSLVYEIECVTCYMGGGHLELGRGKRRKYLESDRKIE